MPKIFIYNGPGVGQNSKRDLKEFFEQTNATTHPEVIECDFHNNFDGLRKKDNPVLAISGGSALFMHAALQDQAAKIKQLTDNGFHFMGECAGAYLAMDKALINTCNYMTHTSKHLEEYSFLGICQDQTLIGPFIPNTMYVEKNEAEKKDLNTKAVVPYRVTTKSALNPARTYPKIYAGGCGFIASAESNYEVVTYYADAHTYVIKNDQRDLLYTDVAANIRKIATPDHGPGGVFLTGTHVSSTLPSSHLLNFFAKGDATHAPLAKPDIDAIMEHGANTRTVFANIIKATFNGP